MTLRLKVLEKIFKSPYKLNGTALGYGPDDWGFESWQRLGIFFSTTSSRPDLGPTQPHIKWVRGALSLGL